MRPVSKELGEICYPFIYEDSQYVILKSPLMSCAAELVGSIDGTR